jgi:flagellar basal body-associated protein FliL
MAKLKEVSKDGQQEGKIAEPKKKGEGGGSKTFVLMFSVAMIVQLIIIAILVYFILKNNSAQSSVAQTQTSGNTADSKGQTGEPGKEEGDAAAKDDGPMIIYQTEDLIINPKGSGGRRYLMTQIGLSVPNEETKKEFEDKRKAQIYDILNQFLATKSIDELADIDKRDSLKIDLKKTLNKEIFGKKIKNVFFSKFVVQ